MTAMSDCRGALNETPYLMSSPSGRSILDRHALSVGAAQRRARAQEVEAEMDMACERAAVGSSPPGLQRNGWNRQMWDRYVTEAVNQARAHGPELQALWRDAARLERLAGVV